MDSKLYYGAVAENPVIILIDNDDGAKPIFAACKGKKIAVQPTLATKDDFYYISDNLYLVKTPEAAGSTCIEDCFEPALLKKIVDGKVFNPHKVHEAPGEYGKAIFAERVIKANITTIKFAGFTPLLFRIESVLQDYQKRKMSGAFA